MLVLVLMLSQDTTPPVVTPAVNGVAECNGMGSMAALQAWVRANGGASALDSCSGSNISWSNNFAEVNLTETCGQAGYYEVTFMAADECGIAAATTARFVMEVRSTVRRTWCPCQLH